MFIELRTWLFCSGCVLETEITAADDGRFFQSSPEKYVKQVCKRLLHIACESFYCKNSAHSIQPHNFQTVVSATVGFEYSQKPHNTKRDVVYFFLRR